MHRTMGPRCTVRPATARHVMHDVCGCRWHSLARLQYVAGRCLRP